MEKLKQEFFIIVANKTIDWSINITLTFIVFSLLGSAFNIIQGTCGLDYPIGYIIYIDLFCEIKGE